MQALLEPWPAASASMQDPGGWDRPDWQNICCSTPRATRRRGGRCGRRWPRHQGPLEMAQEVRKRLAAVERSSSWLDQKRRDALLVDFDRQRQAMVGPIAGHDPDLARIYS